jgi:hypothetical protein
MIHDIIAGLHSGLVELRYASIVVWNPASACCEPVVSSKQCEDGSDSCCLGLHLPCCHTPVRYIYKQRHRGTLHIPNLCVSPIHRKGNPAVCFLRLEATFAKFITLWERCFAPSDVHGCSLAQWLDMRLTNVTTVSLLPNQRYVLHQSETTLISPVSTCGHINHHM